MIFIYMNNVFSVDIMFTIIIIDIAPKHTILFYLFKNTAQ